MAPCDLNEDQNAALRNVRIGDLVLVQQQPRAYWDSEEAEDDEEEEYSLVSDAASDTDEEGSHAEHSDSGADGSIPGGNDDGLQTQTSHTTGAQLSTTNTSNTDHAEHAEHVEHVENVNGSSASNDEHATTDSQQFPSLFLVTSVTRNSDDAVEDLRLKSVQHSNQPDADNLSFQIYGNQCVANLPQVPGLTVAGTNLERIGQESISIRDILGNSDLTFTASPGGDLIRTVMFNNDCPASTCRDGWLHCINDLEDMVRSYVIPSTSYEEQPVCPSCVGIGLMQEHQDLRAELEAFHRIPDFGAIVEFYGRLASRRRVLGYQFVQFDERRWGYLFDDMQSEDGQNAGDDSQYEVWDEPFDASNGAIFHPTSEATIKALPVVYYADVKGEESTSCTICYEAFEDEKPVMLLPCKHFFCADGCLEQWLRQADNCPNCRAKIEDTESKAHDSGNEDEEDGANENSAQEGDEAEGGAIDGDGDVVMANPAVPW